MSDLPTPPIIDENTRISFPSKKVDGTTRIHMTWTEEERKYLVAMVEHSICKTPNGRTNWKKVNEYFPARSEGSLKSQYIAITKSTPSPRTK